MRGLFSFHFRHLKILHMGGSRVSHVSKSAMKHKRSLYLFRFSCLSLMGMPP